MRYSLLHKWQHRCPRIGMENIDERIAVDLYSRVWMWTLSLQYDVKQMIRYMINIGSYLGAISSAGMAAPTRFLKSSPTSSNNIACSLARSIQSFQVGLSLCTLLSCRARTMLNLSSCSLAHLTQALIMGC